MDTTKKMNRAVSKNWGDDGGGGRVPEHETVLFNGAAAAYIDEALQGPDAPDVFFESSDFMPNDDAIYRPCDVCVAPYSAGPLLRPGERQAARGGVNAIVGSSRQLIYWLDRAHEAFGVCEVAVPGEMCEPCTCTFRPLLAGIEAGSEIAMSADGSKVYFLESSVEDHRGGRLWAYIVGGGEVTEVLTGLCRPRGLHVTLGNDVLWIEDSYSASEGPSVRLLPAPAARAASLDNIQDDEVVNLLLFPGKGDLVQRGKYAWFEAPRNDGKDKDDDGSDETQQRRRREREAEFVKFGRPEQLVVLSDGSILVSVRDTSTSTSSLLLFPSPAVLAEFPSESEAASAVCANPLLPPAATIPSELMPNSDYRFSCRAWLARKLPPTRSLALCPKTGAVLLAGCGAVEADGYPTSLMRLLRKDQDPERLMGGFASSLCLDRNGSVFVCPARGGGLRAFWYRGTDRWSLLAAKRASMVPLPNTARSEKERAKSASHTGISSARRGRSSVRSEDFCAVESLLNTSGLSAIATRRECDGASGDEEHYGGGSNEDTNIVNQTDAPGDFDGTRLQGGTFSEGNGAILSVQKDAFYGDKDCDGVELSDDSEAFEDDDVKETTRIGQTMVSLSSSLIEDHEEGAEVTVPLFLDRTTNGSAAEAGKKDSSQSSVAVVLRCRPLLLKEKEARLRQVVKCDMNRDEVHIVGKPRIFKFSRVYDEATSQRRVFHEVVAPLVDKVMAGYSATCFAYGPTGSGKTFTMEGPPAELRTWTEFSQTVQATGMITRAIHMLFHSLTKVESVLSHRVSVSHLEVYNESLYDLLAVSSVAGGSGDASPAKGDRPSPEKSRSRRPQLALAARLRPAPPTVPCSLTVAAISGARSTVMLNILDKAAAGPTVLRPVATGTQLADDRLHHLMRPLKLLEDARTGTQKVSGLTEMDVLTPMDIFRVLGRSTRARFTAETKLNRHSSRSHSIFTINVEMKCFTPEQGNTMKRGKLSLVDLCGSENIKRSGSEGQRAIEAGHIGQSLLVLGRVIRSIIQHAPHIPYRDSKLTRMLSNALGGDAYSVLILNSAPGVNQQEETMNTLKYAELAQGIVNNPHAHVEQLPDDNAGADEARLQQDPHLSDQAEAEAEAGGNGSMHNMTAWVRPWSASVPMRITRTLRASVSATELGYAKNVLRAKDGSSRAFPKPPLYVDEHPGLKGRHQALEPLHSEAPSFAQAPHVGEPHPPAPPWRLKARYAFHRETDDWVRENIFTEESKLSFHATSALLEIFDRHDLDRDGFLSVQEMARLCALWPTDVSTQSDLLSLAPSRKQHRFKLNFATLVKFVHYLAETDSLAVRHLFFTCGYSLSLHLIDPEVRKAARNRKRDSKSRIGNYNTPISNSSGARVRLSLASVGRVAGVADPGITATGGTLGNDDFAVTAHAGEPKDHGEASEVPPATSGNTDFGLVLFRLVKESLDAAVDDAGEEGKGWTTKAPATNEDTGKLSKCSTSRMRQDCASSTPSQGRKYAASNETKKRPTKWLPSRRHGTIRTASFNAEKNSSWQSADARKQFANVAEVGALPNDLQPFWAKVQKQFEGTRSQGVSLERF
jgi:hypothetical protein